ncbi:hypothetical protein JX580_05730 [Thiomicrospira microaerophila]|uniref:hypothetical protein n=1 Tax=Thiomicrospira microaerophila TaxID=406020 RepID=UPI00200BF931|nr:hypothetical protein [Thiomicrospira microaerophila]UQB43359.1 hypothetical protein JX580_05730 [Thiomicrospira microaerophila]
MVEYQAESQLISLLEQEALSDLNSLDLPSLNEAEIKLHHVRIWYFETEKLIRVLGNILPSSMAQPINQLRYAGHHILKAQIGDECEQPNLVEAYKHCKRAYYDAIDLYVYHLSETYRDKLSFLPSTLSSQLAIEIQAHLQRVQDARFDALSRIEYYACVREDLISGLKLVHSVNEQLYASGVTQAVLADRGQLLKENNALKSQVDSELKKAESRFNKWMIGITIFLVAATLFGLLFQGWGTQAVSQDHKFLHIQSELPLFPAPSVNVSPAIHITPESTVQPQPTKE